MCRTYDYEVIGSVEVVVALLLAAADAVALDDFDLFGTYRHRNWCHLQSL